MNKTTLNSQKEKQSMLSLRRATIHAENRVRKRAFLSTLSLRRATVAGFVNYGPADISIHALLAESDSSRLRIKSRLAYISIHAFLAESDGCVERSCKGITIFLSTLSLRRATIPSNGTLRRTHISIHALLAESDTSSTRNQPSRPISIHALLAESDFIRNRLDCAKLAFLSTLSLRRATVGAS